MERETVTMSETRVKGGMLTLGGILVRERGVGGGVIGGKPVVCVGV